MVFMAGYGNWGRDDGGVRPSPEGKRSIIDRCPHCRSLRTAGLRAAGGTAQRARQKKGRAPLDSAKKRLKLSVLKFHLLLLFGLCWSQLCRGQLQVSELMADNVRTLQDEDGDSSDWLEIENTSGAAVDAAGWWLQEKIDSATGWRFPSTNLPPGGRWIVFASGKDRRIPGRPLHTNFRLNAAGGAVFLLRPDGKSVASEIHFDRQYPDVSYGRGRRVADRELVGAAALGHARFSLPAAGGGDWTGGGEPFADAAWRPVTNGVGFDTAGLSRSNLVLYFDFDDIANAKRVPDRGDRAADGVVTGATFTGDATGRSGLPGDRAMNFNGAGVVEVPKAAAGIFDRAAANNQITVSLWIRGGTSQPSQDSVFWAGSAAAGQGTRALNVHLPWSDNVIYWDTGCCDPQLNRVSVAEPNPARWRGVWNHYAFVKNGTAKQIWQNGARLVEHQNTDLLSIIRSFFIGATSPSRSSGYHGMVDDFAVWETALSPSLIGSLASGASPLDLHVLAPYIRTDVGDVLRQHQTTAVLRFPFVLTDPDPASYLVLRAHYKDGFIAYLNGHEVVRRNAPSTATPDAVAPRTRSLEETVTLEEIDLGDAAGFLVNGPNVLAVAGFRAGIDGSAFLLETTLAIGKRSGNRYFTAPTPGGPNDPGYAGLLEPVQVTPDSGFFSVPLEVTLSTASPEASMVYSLDGSDPATVVPAVRTNRVVVQVSGTTVLRARAVLPDYAPTPLETRSYLFPGQVASQRRPVALSAIWPDGSPADFEIDNRVVSRTLPGYEFTNSLRSLPTVSIVTAFSDLFGPGSLYANSTQHGGDWERPASVEWIEPDGTRRFQVDCGLRIHGGISRDNGFTPKHGFNLFFRSEYGVSMLEQDLFPGSPVRRFDKLILRAGSTDTWPVVEWTSPVDGVYRWYRKDASYIRDQWVRDTQIALGQPSSPGTFVQLYLNGFYWGLYNLCERPDDSFAAEHLGGKSEDYDVLADFADVHAGDAKAWNQMMSLAGKDLTVTANYQRLMGNNANGTRNPAYPVLLDVNNLVDYMILHIFIGADDWPNHNWWAACRRDAWSTGFKFFAWDQEISINSLIKQHSSWGPLYAEVNAAGTPAYLYAACRYNADFRQLFADRVQQHLFHGGALSIERNLERWNSRAALVDHALVAESARWGDFRRPGQPYLREREWLTNHLWMQKAYFPSNHTVAIRRFRAANLFPSLLAPELSPRGGTLPSGSGVALGNPNGTGVIYYTTNGEDPRGAGGDVSTAAIFATVPLTITESVRLRARVRTGTTWSPLEEAAYFVTQDFGALQWSEIHYHPASVNGLDGDSLEFIELVNAGSRTLDLSGCRFSEGIGITLAPGTKVGPGAPVILVRNEAAFHQIFGPIPVQGVYVGALKNSGDRVTLLDPVGNVILSLSYSDHAPWPDAADGQGASLQRLNPSLTPDQPAAWVAAAPTPGQVASALLPPPLLGVTAGPDHSLQLSWESPANIPWRLLYAEDLAKPVWQVLQSYKATATNRIIRTGDVAPVENQRFYRLRTP